MTTALVVGGGIAGPVTALALHRVGIDVTGYEAHPGSADGVGGMLTLASNGMAALEILDAAGAVRDIGIPAPRMIMENGAGRRLGELHDLPGLPTAQLVSRADLYRALTDLAIDRGVRIEHGKRLVDAHDDGARVLARFADGTEATADLLVGCDGIRSTVRNLIDPAAPDPRYVGLLGFGGWVGKVGLPPTDGAFHMMFGRRAFFGYFVGADGRAGWFANLPHPEPMSPRQARTVSAEEWLRRLRTTFARDAEPVGRILAAARPETLINIGGMEDLPTVPSWYRGRMVLVGDAAHATSPSSGQGASLAIESGIQLARCLRDLPARQAFVAYQGMRRARVERIIANAARTNANKAAGPVGRRLRDLLMPVAVKLIKPERLAWQFRYAIDFDQPVPAAG